MGEGAYGKVYKVTMSVAVKKIENFNKEAVKEVDTDEVSTTSSSSNSTTTTSRTTVAGFASSWSLQIEEPSQRELQEAQKPGSVWFKEWNIWRCLDHLADALGYLHTLLQPILHRDLKPDNILGVTAPDGGIALKLGLVSGQASG